MRCITVKKPPHPSRFVALPLSPLPQGERAQRRELESAAQGAASELHLRRRLRTLDRGELRHRLVAAEECRGPQQAGEGLELGVVGAHRLDVVAPRDRDAVLGAFELRLQRQEVLVRLEVGIVLADRDQPAERAGELVLRVLELLELLRIGQLVRRRPAPGSPWRAPRSPRSAPRSPAWRSPAPSRPGSESGRRGADSCSAHPPISPWPAPPGSEWYCSRRLRPRGPELRRRRRRERAMRNLAMATPPRLGGGTIVITKFSGI